MHGGFRVPENALRKMIEEKTIPGLVCTQKSGFLLSPWLAVLSQVKEEIWKG